MTAGMKKGILWAKPEKVADRIYSAVNSQRDVVYAPLVLAVHHVNHQDDTGVALQAP